MHLLAMTNSSSLSTELVNELNDYVRDGTAEGMVHSDDGDSRTMFWFQG